MYWDNQPDKYKTIVHPDPYFFVQGAHYDIYTQRCTEEHRMDWENKLDRLYFRGALTGDPFNENGEPQGRYKLLQMSIKHPEDIWTGFTTF